MNRLHRRPTYNYHTHTYRCRHAFGRDEEYVLGAMAAGIEVLGFSDHAPFVFPDGSQSFFRIPMHEATGYVEAMTELRERYRDRIDIRTGFEMEYYPANFERMLETVVGLGADYLILGEHFLGDEYPTAISSGERTVDETRLTRYADLVTEAILTGKYTYVAHPDCMNFVGDETKYGREMERICVASREQGVPLEINFLGIRDRRAYPRDAFWEIVGEIGSPVTFGCDAHTPNSFYDTPSLEVAWEIVDRYGLNYIGAPTIRKPMP